MPVYRGRVDAILHFTKYLNLGITLVQSKSAKVETDRITVSLKKLCSECKTILPFHIKETKNTGRSREGNEVVTFSPGTKTLFSTVSL